MKKSFKRGTAALIALFIAAAALLAACGGGEKADPVVHDGKQLLLDPTFARGFNVRGLNTADGAKVFGRLDYGDASLEPLWNFGQWWAKESIVDGGAERLSDGSWHYYDSTKEMTINTKAGLLKQRVVASKNYDAPRKANEMWLHELCEMSLAGYFLSENTERLPDFRLSEMKELWLTARFKLTYFEDHMGDDAASVNLHSAQYTCFINLQNLNKVPEKDKDFGKLMHLGLPIFDNRFEYTELFAAKDTTSANYIYSLASGDYMSSSFFKDGKPYGSADSEWITVDIDILPYIKEAFARAKNLGYLPNTDWDELYLGACTVGWEVSGTYDAEMWIKDLRIYGVK